MKRFEKLLTLHTFKFVSYRLIWLGLVAVAAWDASKLVHAYLYSNRMTNVEQRYIEDKFPFLENAKVCLWYPRTKTMLPEAWSAFNETEDLKKFAFSEASQANFCDNHNSSEVIRNFTLQEKYDLIKILRHIESADDPRWLFLRSQREIGRKAENLSDAFLASPCAENVMENLAQILRSEFIPNLQIQRPHGGWDWFQKSTGTPIENISVAELTPYGVCFGIPLRDLITPDHKAVTISLMHYQHSVVAEKVWIGFPSTDFWLELKPSDEIFSVNIRISNGGVYDRSEFPPCTSEFSTKNECLEQKSLEDMVETCQCMPLTRKSKLAAKKWRNLPFCTIDQYSKCKAPIDTDCANSRKSKISQYCSRSIRRPSRVDDGSCLPCQYVRNNYFFSTRYRKAFLRYFEKQTVEITFQCSDQFYAFFQEKKQYEIFQLLGLIGGNLGLYIGFSVLGAISVFLSPSAQNDDQAVPAMKKKQRRNLKFWTRFLTDRMRSMVLVAIEKTDDELPLAVRHELDELDKKWEKKFLSLQNLYQDRSDIELFVSC